jgi:YidC/Oxa1 family membrane protein insertase
MAILRDLRQNYSAYRKFEALPIEQKRIVLYSEGKTYWPFLKPFVTALIETTNEHPIYVSSDENDPGLKYCPERMQGFQIGEGTIRTLWFSSLTCKVLIMTMPDLQVFHIKRSKVYPVNYVYANHGCDSIHMVLREQALDYFDTIFLSGPHNEKEIRSREHLKGLPAKKLFNIGYPYLDELIKDAEPYLTQYPSEERPLCVLIAPSWSEKGSGTLETVGNVLVGLLLNAGFETIVRPHPQTRKLFPECIEEIRRTYSGNPLFTLDENANNKKSLMKADILITDWSAIAMEFSFSRLRPVLYIDVPKKTMNPNYTELGIEPLEVSIRTEIGAVLHPDNIHGVVTILNQLGENIPAFSDKINIIREKTVYHIGQSAIIGAETLVHLADD